MNCAPERSAACIKGRGAREAIGPNVRGEHALYPPAIPASAPKRLLRPAAAPAPKVTPEHERRLAEALKKRPDATLEQLRKACGAPVSKPAIRQQLKKLGRWDARGSACTPADATRPRCGG